MGNPLGLATVSQALLDSPGPRGHVDKDHDEQHQYSQRRQDDCSHLLSGFLHGVLTLLLVFRCLFLGFAFELPHDVFAALAGT